MAIANGSIFTVKDVYVDYPFEEVMFRWDHAARRVFIKQYGEDEQNQSVTANDPLFNDALLIGDEITRQDYLDS